MPVFVNSAKLGDRSDSRLVTVESFAVSRSVILSFVVLLTLCAAPCAAQTKKKQQPKSRSRTSQPRTELIAVVDEHMPEAWKPFSSAQGRFSILFPGEPKEMTEVNNIPAGSVVERRAQLITNIAWYEANFAAGPVTVETPDRMIAALDAMRNDVLARNPGQLLTETSINIQGHPGRQVVWRTEKGLLMKVRFIVSGNRIYSLLFAIPEQNDLSDEIRQFRKSIEAKFFESFKLSAN